jgi:hypothetical protein
MNEALTEIMNYYESGGTETFTVAFSLEYFNPNNDFHALVADISRRIDGKIETEGCGTIISKGDIYISVEYDDMNTIYLCGADNINIHLSPLPFPPLDPLLDYDSDDFDY